ncbi:J domain-containing protein [Roseospirillum parvum]|uniref:DnaJ domain-containing protein n=1 Tax=Roseospirillum parvum TaxID=83401 RepID=A0A1G7WG93_9PROT|nr:J domain-containing protein [Roseospirillum parvum]SDG70918.1 DnaJ domain-containing protein [Roseospirillum parvum]
MAPRDRLDNPAFDPFHLRQRAKVEDGVRPCAHPGCPNPGTHRAPRDPSLTEYVWLCLEHVQQHNRNWNYFAGMDAEQIEAERRKDALWHRPTWRLGQRGGGRPREPDLEDLDDPLGLFDEERRARAQARADRFRRADHSGEPAEKARAAMNLMELDPPLTLDALKRRYKQLVKRYHPDATGGDKVAEERFKLISQAYRTLIDSLRQAEEHTTRRAG